jgi:2,5-diketo-D-gluconate reductase A
MSTMPTIEIAPSVRLPQIGFGWDRPGDLEAQVAVEYALQCGYTLIDTASYYRNETGIGAALSACSLPRDAFAVSTKVWNSDHGREPTRRALDRSLQALGVDHVDLLLIHWPCAESDLYVETWKAFEELLSEGLTRAIGVSNFEPKHLERLREDCELAPALNQVEVHPLFQQLELRRFHEQRAIATGAWRPLALGRVLEDPVIVDLAERLERDPAQIVLRWHLQSGLVAVPKTGTPERIRGNLDVLDFELDDGDMSAIAGLDGGEAGRIGPHPDVFNARTDAEVEAFIDGVDPKRPKLA